MTFFCQKRRGLCLVCCALMLVSCSGGGGSSQPVTPTAVAPTSALSAMQSRTDSAAVDGMFAYIEESDGTTTVVAAGIQDRDTSAPADAAALFKIASVSKLFIAASAAKLAYQEIISLDDPISFWLPALAARIENAETITIRHLIRHRSGVPDFDSQAGFSWDDPHTDIDATLAFALDQPADFAPDERYEYSNTNYLLLGKILDAALGYSHRTYIQDFILTPLGMSDTYLVLADVDTSRMVSGYWKGTNRRDQDYVIPGGSMVSTVTDIGIFLRSLARGDLLNANERTIYASVYGFEHSGWLPGYQGIANYEASLDAVVVLFMNTTGGGSEAALAATYSDILEVIR